MSVNKCRNRLEHCRFPMLFFHAMFTQRRGILLSNLFLYQFPMFRGDLTPGKHAHNASAVYPRGRRNRSGVQNNSNTFPTQICSRSRHSILATARSQILVHQSNTVDNIYRFVWLVSPCVVVIFFCSLDTLQCRVSQSRSSTLSAQHLGVLFKGSQYAHAVAVALLLWT